MAASKCVACGQGTFEVVAGHIKNGNYKTWFIQCASCGGVVGVHEHAHIGHAILKQNVALKAIAAGLNVFVDLPIQ